MSLNLPCVCVKLHNHPILKGLLDALRNRHRDCITIVRLDALDGAAPFDYAPIDKAPPNRAAIWRRVSVNLHPGNRLLDIPIQFLLCEPLSSGEWRPGNALRQWSHFSVVHSASIEAARYQRRKQQREECAMHVNRPNDSAHRPGAKCVRHETMALPPGSRGADCWTRESWDSRNVRDGQSDSQRGDDKSGDNYQRPSEKECGIGCHLALKCQDSRINDPRPRHSEQPTVRINYQPCEVWNGKPAHRVSDRVHD